jgi:tetratricopeptide (TPR) repeat protein
MKHRFVPAVFIAILAAALGRAPADDIDQTSPDPDGSIALAERFATAAHQIFRHKHIPANALQMSADLYRAAMRLEPDEPRFARSLADILLVVNDVPGAIQALKDYLNLDKNDAREDQTAQVQLIDLYLSSDAMESLDQRLNYLRFLLKKQAIAAPVKSEIALRAARLLIDRGQNDQAMKLLDSARVLNPMNLQALRIRYTLTQETALPVDRVQQLLGILQANPADPVVASRLAEQLAQLGLVDAALTWYAMANELYTATNVRPDPAFVLGTSSELLIAKHPTEARAMAGMYNVTLPDDADGWFISLSVLKFQLAIFPGDQDMQADYTALIRKASIAVSNRLQSIRKVSGDATATTRPIDSPDDTVLPDLSDDPIRMKAYRARMLVAPYEASLASLAWLDLYYRRDAALAKPLIDALARVAPDDDVTLQRLRAWQQYVGGEATGALPKLQALAKLDPLAQLGVILIELNDPRTKGQAILQAQRLIDEHPSGVIGAVFWAEFSRLHVKIDPSPASATVATLVSAVPQSFLELIRAPKSFYDVQVAPLKATFEFGEPILVRVTLQNISGVDLAIGDDCAIHPELWFDARLIGMLSQGIYGVAIGRLDQRLVLAPGDSVSTVLRIDQDALHVSFSTNPQVDLMVKVFLVLNPTQVRQAAQYQSPQAQPGVGGYTQSAQTVARESIPIQSADQRSVLYRRMDSDDGGEKIRAMDAITSFIGVLNGMKGSQIKPVLDEFVAKIHLVDAGANPSVQAYQKYLLTTLAQGEDQANSLASMVTDEHWQTRLLALIVAGDMGGNGIDAANQLSADQDPIVKSYALALCQSLRAAATQPSTPAPAPAPQTTQPSDTP